MPRKKNAPDWRDQTGRNRDDFLPGGGSETGASHLPGTPREDEHRRQKRDDP